VHTTSNEKIDKRRWVHKDSSLEPTTLLLRLLFSIILLSGVFVALSISYSYQIRAEDKQIVNSTYRDLESQTSPQLMVFDLPSKTRD
jgi:hypothetical protein